MGKMSKLVEKPRESTAIADAAPPLPQSAAAIQIPDSGRIAAAAATYVPPATAIPGPQASVPPPKAAIAPVELDGEEDDAPLPRVREVVGRAAAAQLPATVTERVAGMVEKSLAVRAREIRIRYRVSDSAMLEEGLKLLFAGKSDAAIADYLKKKGHSLRRTLRK